MRLRHSGVIAVASALLVSLASAAGAAVLWDQTNIDPTFEGSLNLASSSCNAISGNTKLHNASDVHFSQPVNIQTVRILESLGNVEAASQAFLWIAPKTGPMPTAISTDVNNVANNVPISISYTTVGTTTVAVVSATGLNISLPAGDYWVSLTPRHSRGLFPYTVHLVTAGPIVGDPTATIEACTVNSNWIYVLAPNMYDYSLKIEGEFPVPTVSKSWGHMKSLYR
ncbi:MAG: hypothetical protein ACREOU_10600 [Candidatus Eiseniibacteriota bacterium]